MWLGATALVLFIFIILMNAIRKFQNFVLLFTFLIILPKKYSFFMIVWYYMINMFNSTCDCMLLPWSYLSLLRDAVVIRKFPKFALLFTFLIILLQKCSFFMIVWYHMFSMFNYTCDWMLLHWFYLFLLRNAVVIRKFQKFALLFIFSIISPQKYSFCMQLRW